MDNNDSGPRKVKLALAKIDPWTVMKVSFLLSVAAGISLVITVFLIWSLLEGMHVFKAIEEIIAPLDISGKLLDLLAYLHLSKVLSLATMIAIANVVLLTAMSTLIAFLYNIVTALVGGIKVTMIDE